MPIPGSSLGFIDIQAIGATMPQLYPSLATFYKKTKTTDTAGQETHTFVQMDSAHTNVKCRKAPLILVRPQLQILPRMVGEFDIAKSQVNTMVRFNDVEVNDQVNITDPDGSSKRYQIMSIEDDGTGLTSRFMIGDEVPFNA